MSIKLIFIYTFLACVFAIDTSAQTVTDCPHPSGCVVISRDAALKALADADRVKALEAEVVIKDTAIEDFRKEVNRMRIEFAEKSGEATALKQNAVQDRAIIEVLLKNSKKKCGFISILCL